jgi:outer membrane murein-binding lipoprotein Lpp
MTKLQKDHLMILLESMDSKMQITLETVCSMNDKIEGVETRLNARIDNLESIQNITMQAVASLDKKLSAQIDAVDKKVDAVHKELVAHRNDTEQHSNQPKRPLKRVL